MSSFRVSTTPPRRRRGNVHHDLGPARRSTKRRAVRNPEVLADLDREGAEGKAEQKVAERDTVDRRHHARDSEGEDPALVEHVVVREVLLGDDPDDLPRRDHGDGVIEKASVGHREADGEDRGKGKHPRRLRELAKRAILSRDESRPLNQVLGGISRKHLLGESDEPALRLRGLGRHPDHLLEVLVIAPTVGFRFTRPILEKLHQ
jgi:hypothetical protein